MANKPLDSDAIAALLAPKPAAKPKNPASSPYPGHPHNGPFRYTEEKGHCSRRGCNVQSYLTVSGVRLCSPHAIAQLNKLLVKLGVEAEKCPGCGIYWNNNFIGPNDYEDITFVKEAMAYCCKHCGAVIREKPTEGNDAGN